MIYSIAFYGYYLPAAKPDFGGHLAGRGTMPPRLRKNNNLNFLIFINFICHERLVGFKIKKKSPRSRRASRLLSI